MSAPTVELGELVRSLPWELPNTYMFQRVEHITIQQPQALTTEVVRLGRAGEHSIRFVAVLDSRVAVGAIAKGRSSSRHLNAALQKLCVASLAFDISVTLLWVDTHSNPADAPSRGVDLPRRGDPPPWVVPLWKTW